MPSPRFTVVVLLGLLVLAWAACGGSPGRQAAESQGDIGPGAPFDLDAALAKLREKSHYSQFYVAWEGIREGAPASGSLDMERVWVREPAAQEVFATVSRGESGEREVFAFVQSAGRSWFYHQGGDGTWWETPGRGLEQFTDATFFTPETFFDGFDLRVDGPLSPSPEAVDGVLAYEYSFDVDDLSSEEIAFREAWGHLHAAAESGCLLELHMSADVVYHTPGGPLESGEIQVRFEATDVGGSFAVEPPRTARADLPLPPDVTLPDPTPVPLSRREKDSPAGSEGVRYQTGASVAEVAALYLAGMPELGWDPLIYDVPLGSIAGKDRARMQYVKGDEAAVVLIELEEEGGTTEVRIDFRGADEARQGPCGLTWWCSELAMIDFPTPPDARVRMFVSGGGIPGQMYYETTCGVDEVVRLYTTAMPADGWEETAIAAHTPEPGVTALGYVRDGEEVAVSISDAEGVTGVMVQAGPAALGIRDYPGPEDLRMTREFPITSDAVVSKLMPRELRYATGQTVAAVLGFYETALADAGWTGRPGGVEGAETAVLRYERAEVTATLMVKQGIEAGEGSIVWVTLYRR